MKGFQTSRSGRQYGEDMTRSARVIARESFLRARGDAHPDVDVDVDDAPAPLHARGRRIVALTIALIVLGGYLVVQVIGLATTKDAVPPSWLIPPPAGATVVGEPRIDYEPYRATTYVTIRPAEGQNAHQLVEQMGLSEQPTQIGPTPLDWRPVWVYNRPTQEGVELRLVYRRDSSDITP
jgi:hypothetical protein